MSNLYSNYVKRQRKASIYTSRQLTILIEFIVNIFLIEAKFSQSFDISFSNLFVTSAKARRVALILIVTSQLYFLKS